MNKFNRREFVKWSGTAMAMTALPSLLRQVHGEEPITPRATDQSQADQPAGIKAKRLIQVYLAGGPFQGETWDPHPENGPYSEGKGTKPSNGPKYYKAIPTNIPGIEISEGCPMLAKQMDKYSIIRNFRLPSGLDHGSANYAMNTGALPSSDMVRPTCTAVAGMKLADPSSVVPPYVFLTVPNFQFAEAGFLGPCHMPFATGGDPSWPGFNAGLNLPKEITVQHAQERQALLQQLGNMNGKAVSDEESRNIIEYQKKAYKLITEEGKKAFDLSQEKKEVRERYGMNWAGQSMLLARRLVEADHGAKVVKIFWMRGSGAFGGWDTHAGTHYQGTLDNQIDMDRGVAALLEDLAQRGLLDSTIVLCGGEFGRSPHLGDALGGRAHYTFGFSWLVAGGGFKGGRVMGKTDNLWFPIGPAVYPWDLWSTVYQLLGIDSEERVRDALGRPLPLLPLPPTSREFAFFEGTNGGATYIPKDYKSPYTLTDEKVSYGLLKELL